MNNFLCLAFSQSFRSGVHTFTYHVKVSFYRNSYSYANVAIFLVLYIATTMCLSDHRSRSLREQSANYSLTRVESD